MAKCRFKLLMFNNCVAHFPVGRLSGEILNFCLFSHKKNLNFQVCNFLWRHNFVTSLPIVLILVFMDRKDLALPINLYKKFQTGRSCKNLGKGYFAVDKLNVCELLKSKSLTKQTLSKPKDIYMYLNIETSDFLT